MESSVVNTGANITGTADFLIGKPLQSLGWEDNFISEWNSYYQDKAEEKHQDVMEAAARTGKGRTAKIAGEILTFLGEAGIDTILSGATGGALAAAKFGSKGGKVLKYADDFGDLAKLDFDDVSDAGKSLKGTQQKRTIKIDLQFFAEKDILNQSSKQLRKGIKSFEKRIEEHQNKLANPSKYDVDWEIKPEIKKKGLLKHWRKEINNFKESINSRIEELKNRGDYYDD